MEAQLKIKSQSKCQIQKITTSLPCFIQELAPFETFEKTFEMSQNSRGRLLPSSRPSIMTVRVRQYLVLLMPLQGFSARYSENSQ